VPAAQAVWDVAAAEVTDESVTRDARADYEDGREKFQRFYY